MRKLGAAGLRIIKNFEGCRLVAYKPVAAEPYYTIGWGHYGPDVKEGERITQAEADALLAKDLERYVAHTNNPSNVPIIKQLTQNQFDALVSFCYNCGPGNLQKLCKGRTAKEIAENMPKYNKGSGQVLLGLTRRRAAEVELFNTPDKPAKENEDLAKIAELEKKIQEQDKIIQKQADRIGALETHVNISGKQNPPKWAEQALIAAKKVGAITTTADKGMAEIKMIQTLYNMGLFNPDVIAMLKNAKKEV